MNGLKVNIVTQMILLIINSFDAKPHLQKKMKRMFMNNDRACNLLLQRATHLLDDIPNVIHNYTMEHQSKGDFVDLDYMLYIYLKEIVSNYTTYFSCEEELIGRDYKKNRCVLNQLCV